MPMIKTKDGVEIFYKDWGSGSAHRVQRHGWPLSADDWDAQMLFFLGKGFRVIATPMRHGRSSQVADGHDMDHYADDLAALTTSRSEKRGACGPLHRRRRGRALHRASRRGRVAKAAIIAAVPPLMVKSGINPGGLPKDVFDGLQVQTATNRAQFYRDRR